MLLCSLQHDGKCMPVTQSAMNACLWGNILMLTAHPKLTSLMPLLYQPSTPVRLYCTAQDADKDADKNELSEFPPLLLLGTGSSRCTGRCQFWGCHGWCLCYGGSWGGGGAWWRRNIVRSSLRHVPCCETSAELVQLMVSSKDLLTEIKDEEVLIVEDV